MKRNEAGRMKRSGARGDGGAPGDWKMDTAPRRAAPGSPPGANIIC